MKVFVFGAGKVGRALARGLERAGDAVTLRPARRGFGNGPIDADLVVLAVRDHDLGALATRLANAGVLARRAVVVHNAGGLDASVLAPLRAVCAGVAQMHPLVAFASTRRPPTLAGGQVHVKGDPAAERRARTAARHLGMTPRTYRRLDPVAYHAAAGLVANGASALTAMGVELLVGAGVPAADAPKLLGSLLRSVAENVERLGFPDALTGPVRRGDAVAVARQLALLERTAPTALPLFVASGRAQLPLARKLGDASAEALDRVEALLADSDGAARKRARMGPRRSTP